MCLHTVDPKIRRVGTDTGYKSVEKLEDGTYTCYDCPLAKGTVKYPLNRWVTDPKEGPIGWTKQRYETGIHISLDMEVVARLDHPQHPNWVGIKVKFRKIVATSVDAPDHTYGRQVVAKQVMNLGEIA